MKVVHLVQDRGIRPDSRKGAAVHVRAMCDAFNSIGASVLQIHASTAAVAREKLEAPEVLGADVVYERYALGAFEGARIARLRGLPHVLEVNAPLEEEAARWRNGASAPLDRDEESAMFEDAALVLCVSPEVAEFARRRGATEDSVLVRPNGVDRRIFRPLESTEADRLGWFPDLDAPLIVGFHGRLRAWHGFERIVESCRMALEMGCNLAVLCVGEGDFEATLAGQIPRRRWRREPWCDQAALARWVAGFHVLPLAYDPDQSTYFSPLKLREAMAAGVVPIVPDVGNLSVLVGHGDAGVVLDSRAELSIPAALAASYHDLQADRSRLGRLRERAIDLAAGNSWETIARETLQRVGAVARG